VKHVNPLAMRSAIPLETREDDPLAAATRAVEELRSTVAQFRGDTDKKVGDALAKIEARAAEITTRLDAIETRAQRPGLDTGRTDEQAALEKRAFEGFLRRGRESLTDVEIRSLRVNDDTTGGYLAPAEFSVEVDKNLVQFSPVRQAARVGQTASGEVIIPRRTGRPTASWVGEVEARPSTQPAYGQVTVPIDEQACYIDVSNKLLEDSAVNVSAEVAFDLAEELGRLEGQAFVSGDGIKKPLGFMSDIGLSYTPSGSASVITDADGGANGIIDLFYAVAPFYRGRAVFMGNSTTIAALRKMKDSQKQYLWQPAIAAGQPETFLGRPIIEAVDMPDIAGNAFPLVFGDFSSGFRIYDRITLSLLRDPYSQATSGLTRFHARRRVGARVVRAEAIRKLKISTT
jgi:HK97 family phage major capsid protein